MANSKNRCSHCKHYFSPNKMIVRGKLKFCCTEHMISYAAGKGRKAAKANRQERERIKQTTTAQLNRSSLSWQHKKTQQAFNKMRVLEELKFHRDQGFTPVCISCQRPIGGDQWCCGHLKTVGSHPELRYDRLNTHLQHNHRCNQRLSGDITGTKDTIGYIEGLKVRHGEERATEIIEHLNSYHPPKKYTCEDLELMRKEFNAKIRELKANGENQ